MSLPLYIEETRFKLRLLPQGDKAIKPNLANAINRLENAPELADMLSYDFRAQRVMALGGTPWAPESHEWGTVDDIRLVEWLQRHGCGVRLAVARQAVLAVAWSRSLLPANPRARG